MDWNHVRRQFPALEDWTYLNTATMGLLPQAAEAAALRHLTHRNRLACTDFLNWYDDLDRLRGKLAHLFGGTADDYAFFNASAPILSMLMAGVDWKPGDRVVTLKDEFPNQIYYASLLADRGVELVETDGPGFWSAVDGGRTRLVALSAMNYRTGFCPPLGSFGQKLRERRILFYLDGTQGAGALRYDMAELDPDIFAVHGYKWMLAPAGAAFAYFSPRVREWLAPSVIGWRSHHEWRNVSALHHGRPVFSPAAERYEGQMMSSLLFYMLEASVDLMLEIGATAIEQRVLGLAAEARERLQSLGGKIVTEGASPIVAVRMPGDAERLAGVLKQNRIAASIRHANIRLSFHLYNSERDTESLLMHLQNGY